MSEADFQKFRETYILEIAEENIKAGLWKAFDAMERSRRAFEERLPDGLRAEDHHFFVIIDALTGQPVGHLWLGREEGPDGPVGFLFRPLCRQKAPRPGVRERCVEGP